MAIRNYPRWRRHLEFIRIENSAIRSAVPENPTLEPNMKWIGSPVAEHFYSRMLGAYETPNFCGEGEGKGPTSKGGEGMEARKWEGKERDKRREGA